MVEINGVNVPNEAKEMKLREYSYIASIMNHPKIDEDDKYVKIFTFWGVDEDYLRFKLPYSEFRKLIKEFQTSIQKKVELTHEIEVGGYTYATPEGDFEPSVADIKEIKKAFGKESYLCDMIAILFKRTDLSDKEHYAKAHIKLKSKLFGELNAEFAIPYLVLFAQYLIKQSEDAKAAAEVVESDNA